VDSRETFCSKLIKYGRTRATLPNPNLVDARGGANIVVYRALPPIVPVLKRLGNACGVELDVQFLGIMAMQTQNIEEKVKE
jgi:hypothetical protein